VVAAGAGQVLVWARQVLLRLPVVVCVMSQYRETTTRLGPRRGMAAAYRGRGLAADMEFSCSSTHSFSYVAGFRPLTQPRERLVRGGGRTSAT